MGSISGVPVHATQTVPTTQTVPVQSAPALRAADGDTAAQETAEPTATKLAEAQNGGFAPNSAGLVNILV